MFDIGGTEVEYGVWSMEHGVWRTEYSVHPTDMQYVGSVPVDCSASNGLDLRRKKKGKKRKRKER